MARLLLENELRWTLDDLSFVEESLKHRLKKKGGPLAVMAQERAISAMELGLGIRQRGYNIFAVGASGTGRTSTVNQMLLDRAPSEKTPDDLVLLYNFENRNRPVALALPPSSAPKLKKTFDHLVERMLVNLEQAFESEHFLNRKQEIQEKYNNKTDLALKLIEEKATENQFVLERGGGAITLTPADQDGRPITEEVFDALDSTKKHSFEKRAEILESLLEDALRKVRAIEKESEDEAEKLSRETATRVLDPLFDAAKSAWETQSEVQKHLEAMQEDVIKRIQYLLPQEQDDENDNRNRPPKSHLRHLHDEDDDGDRNEHALIRYRVNPFVTHIKNAGAPIVHETHPTSSNLIGSIEQRVKDGETVTDFTRIRAGALYQANGGYLVLEAQAILRDLSAWDGLKRALKNREIELDDPGEPGRMVAIASLRPEPIPLALKVILIGTPEVYYALIKNDPDFSKLFKVKADFEMDPERSADFLRQYLHFLAAICQEEKLRSFSPKAAGRVMEYAVRLSGRQSKLTSRLGDIADLAREANFWAMQDRTKKTEIQHVRRALAKRAEREGSLETQMIEEIIENRVTIDTSGAVIGQVNALTIIELGSYEFGIPVRVTCRIGCGKGNLIDIERETDLGGPLHTKGTLIIRGILLDRFGRDIPLRLTATLCMEQSYSEIDGDSASLAETCALFSMLSGVPIMQNFAITGSVDQLGKVQAIGGINEKIEGFFKICKGRGDQKAYAIIIPEANARDLMLNEELVEACKAKKLTIHAVSSFDEALELLTGKRWSKGTNSLKSKIEKTLKDFSKLAKAHAL